jgi:RNA polymerase sigma-70 factor (ECF subfamily)
MDSEPQDPSEFAATTLHVRRARAGDAESLSWVVRRFTPLLLAHARHRMGPLLLARLEPEDVVNDVWATALPRLPDLAERDGRNTPVLLRFLSTALLHRINNLLRLRATDAESAPDPLSALSEQTRGPLTRVVAQERQGLVLAALDELGERDREVILLRALEQHSNVDTAELLGLEPNTAAQVYRRALARLRERLPGTVFDELED